MANIKSNLIDHSLLIGRINDHGAVAEMNKENLLIYNSYEQKPKLPVRGTIINSVSLGNCSSRVQIRSYSNNVQASSVYSNV